MHFHYWFGLDPITTSSESGDKVPMKAEGADIWDCEYDAQEPA